MKKVIIADDSPSFLAVLKELFEDAGYDVLALEDGEKVLKELAKGIHCDLLVTDIVMPAQDGIGVLLEIHNSYPRIKCIAISGGGRVVAESYLTIAEKLGAGAVFKKPFNLDDLLKAAKEMLGE